LISKVAGKYTREVASATVDLSEFYGLEVKRGGMPEEPRSDGVASVSGGIAAELAAAGFVERHAEVVATVGNTVYCIGGANRPTHEGPVATVEALDFK
jgi:ribosomal protein S19E (S16A)